MSSEFPYFLYSCPCVEDPTASKSFDDVPPSPDEAQEEDQSLNPHSARSSFSSYPLEHLLFCNECHEIRCPRCYFEEALYYYCPSCLFEVPNNVVKCETNRCTRSCFQCPLCIAPLALQSYQSPAEDKTQPNGMSSARDGPCILSCLYCNWSSLDIGIVFDRPVNISGQLAKLKNGGVALETPKEGTGRSGPSELVRSSDSTDMFSPGRARPSDQFTQMVMFYKAQIADTTPAAGLPWGAGLGLDSPSQLSRLLSTYGVGGLKKQRGKMPVMREAMAEVEGLRYDSLDAEDETIERMRRLGWDGTTSCDQSLRQQQSSPRFHSDMRPVQTQLRSKRAKRCRTCRHNLVKPDEKRQRNKYHIRLVALNFLPTITLKLMDAELSLQSMQPMKTAQFLLTFRNPMFDLMKVTLATPPTTPGDIASRVTLLCPQFEIGSNTDVWDEALDVSAERRKAREALEGIQAEAGKIWERGRNWTTVILEVVPGSLSQPSQTATGEQETAVDRQINREALEIPIFVRLEYETDETATGALHEEQENTGKERKIRREMAYWCVVGVGRIAKE